MKLRSDLVFLFSLVFLSAVLLATATTTYATDVTRVIDGVSYTFGEVNYQAPTPNVDSSTPGRLYVPTGYDAAKPLPVVMFLHGVGENGSNNRSQINPNIDNLIKAAETQNFLLYAPQSTAFWSTPDRPVSVLGKLTTQYNIDTRRIAVTGLSAGGQGTQLALKNYGDLFSAFVPIALAGQAFSTPAQASASADKAVWHYVARNDSLFSQTRKSVDNLLLAQGQTPPNWNDDQGGGPYYTSGDADYFESDRIRFTEYDTGGHSRGTWGRTYNETQLYDWVLDQQSLTGDLTDGDTIRVKFAPDSNRDGFVDAHGQHWNVAGGHLTQRAAEVAVAFARNQLGQHTNVQVELHDPFWIADSDTPSDIADTYWLTRNKTNGEDDGHAGITLHGLSPGGTYDLRLFASHTGTGFDVLYTAGSQSVTFNAANNLDDFITFNSLVADADGRLTLSILTNGGSEFGVLNTLELTAVSIPEPGTSVCVVLLILGTMSHSRRQRWRKRLPPHPHQGGGT